MSNVALGLGMPYTDNSKSASYLSFIEPSAWRRGPTHQLDLWSKDRTQAVTIRTILGPTNAWPAYAL